MRFGPVPLDAARGAVLAHSVALPDGRLRKGRVLEAADIDRLHAAGLDRVIVAQLERGDVAEDAAAERLAAALVPDPARALLRVGLAATGRVNLHAEAHGVTEVLAPRIRALNALHPMITVATVPEWQRVAPGDMVATVKIISYAVPQPQLEAACDAGQAALRLRPVTRRRAALIETVVPGASAPQKGRAAVEARLTRMGAALAVHDEVAHDCGALSAAIRRAIDAAQADIVLILTGSATSDDMDVAPQALRAAGGQVVHFGMPVDPGNLLFFGHHGDVPVIGLPGCARSPALNGADWVLERLICDVPLTGADVMDMGVGGLLKEIPQRGRPREG